MSDMCDLNNRTTRIRLSFDSKVGFPSKLFDVVNDGYLIKWNSNGTGILVDENEFEEKVMKCYPGFVQIRSFLNFRRLFRAYSFGWQILEETDSVFQFNHPGFIKDRPDLLYRVASKRKCDHGFGFSSGPRRFRSRQNRYDADEDYANISTPQARRRFRRFGKKSTQICANGARQGKDSDEEPITKLNLPALTSSSSGSSQSTSFCEHRGIINDFAEEAASDFEYYQLYPSTHVFNSTDGRTSPRPSQQDLLNVLALFAQNELNEEENLQLLAKIAADERFANSVARESISSQSVPSVTTAEEFVPLVQCANVPSGDMMMSTVLLMPEDF